MRPLILALAISATGALMALGAASVALADAGPHAGTYSYGSGTSVRDSCAGCHRTHTGQGQRLIKAESIQALCFTCHQGSSAALNVWDGTENSAGAVVGVLRGGGFVNARIDVGHDASVSGDAGPGGVLAGGEAVKSAHVKFGATAGTDGNALTPKNIIWGEGAAGSGSGKGINSTPLTCGDCHNPHGNGSYRILRPIPKLTDSAGAGQVVPDIPPAVAPATREMHYDTVNYWTQYKVGATAGIPWSPSEMSNWCSTCHSRYKADGNAGSVALGGESIFKYRHVSDGSDNLGGKTGAPYGAEAFYAQCLQCHVAHGSNATQATTRASSSGNVAWPDGSTRIDNGVADSSLLKVNNRGTCVLCHGTSGAGYGP